MSSSRETEMVCLNRAIAQLCCRLEKYCGRANVETYCDRETAGKSCRRVTRWRTEYKEGGSWVVLQVAVRRRTQDLTPAVEAEVGQDRVGLLDNGKFPGSQGDSHIPDLHVCSPPGESPEHCHMTVLNPRRCRIKDLGHHQREVGDRIEGYLHSDSSMIGTLDD